MVYKVYAMELNRSTDIRSTDIHNTEIHYTEIHYTEIHLLNAMPQDLLV